MKYQMMVIATTPNLVDQLQADLSEYQFTQYHTIDSAIQACMQAFPEIIFFDDQMGSDTLLYALKSVPKGDKIPIVVMVDGDDDATINRITELGFFDYLIKPIRSQLVAYRIRQILVLQQIYQMQEALRQSEERHRIISNTISDYAYWYGVLEDRVAQKRVEYPSLL